jgi:hypothetical protein
MFPALFGGAAGRWPNGKVAPGPGGIKNLGVNPPVALGEKSGLDEDVGVVELACEDGGLRLIGESCSLPP